MKQIKLSDKHVKSFIDAQADLATVRRSCMRLATIAPALQTELEGIAKKHGFLSFAEFDNVAANISLVMAGLDPKSGEFTDPVEALKKELSDVTADASIPDADKKQLMQEFTEAISTTPPLQHIENVELVKTHRDEIEKALQ